MAALDWVDHLVRRTTPMFAVYATTTAMVTVAAGTQHAWYGLMGPLDAEQSPAEPGIGYLILYHHLHAITGLTYCFLRISIQFWGIVTVCVGFWSHVEILT